MPGLAPLLVSAAAGAAALAWSRTGRIPLRITRYRVPWPGLEERRVVVHVTDVHVGLSTPPALLEEVAEASHRAQPDLVALTGDYVNASRVFFPRMQAFVRALPQPVVAVLGNHDHLVGGRAIRRGLEAAGAVVLQNEKVEMAGLTVVGVDDGFTRHDRVDLAFEGVVGAPSALVLTHFPPTANAIAERTGGRLILAGHTHAGQFDLPGRWTERLARATRLGGYLRGFYPLANGVELYVNAGLGHAWRGMRSGELCRPEMAVFELEPAEARVDSD